MAKVDAMHKKKVPRAVGKRKSNGSKPTAAEIHGMIEQAAYFRAERRNFAPGFEETDWFEAEQEISRHLEK